MSPTYYCSPGCPKFHRTHIKMKSYPIAAAVQNPVTKTSLRAKVHFFGHAPHLVCTSEVQKQERHA